MNFSTYSDRIRGAYLGHALGDALGAPFEFRYSYPLKDYTGRLELPILYRTRYGPIQKSAIGQTTDDNSMATAILSLILSTGNWTSDSAILTYLAWANSGLKFLGRNTRALLKGITTLQGFQNRAIKLDRNSASNGSLMRAVGLLPLFDLLPEDQAWQSALADTAITNPTQVNLEATRVYLAVFRMIKDQVSPQQGIPILSSLITDSDLRTALEQAVLGQLRNVKDHKGWVCHGIYVVIQVWLQAVQPGASFRPILDWVIRLGGDTDTLGAIAGAVIGFYFGEIQMKQDPITSNNINIILSIDTNTGEFPLESRYLPITGYGLLVERYPTI